MDGRSGDQQALSEQYLRDHSRRLQWTLSHMTPGERWFDTGSGSSTFRDALSRTWGRSCDTAQNNLDYDPLPFDDHTFDTVTSFEVVEHLLNPLYAMRESHRILKPGGRLYLSTPNKDSFIYKIKHYLGHIQEGHFHEYRIHELRWLLTEAGFKDIIIRPFRQSPYGTIARIDKQWLWVEATA